MAKNITATLPPKHGGYRAVQPSTTSKGERTAPKPPPGEGGGSKGRK